MNSTIDRNHSHMSTPVSDYFFRTFVVKTNGMPVLICIMSLSEKSSHSKLPFSVLYLKSKYFSQRFHAKIPPTRLTEVNMTQKLHRSMTCLIDNHVPFPMSPFQFVQSHWQSGKVSSADWRVTCVRRIMSIAYDILRRFCHKSEGSITYTCLSIHTNTYTGSCIELRTIQFMWTRCGQNAFSTLKS